MGLGHGGGRLSRRQRCSGGCLAALQECQHVALGQSSVLAACCDSCRVEVVFFNQLAYRRRQRLRFGYLRRGRCWFWSGGRFGCRRRFFGGGRALTLGNGTQERSDLDVGAFGGRNLAERPGCRGVDLQRHLVGFQLEQRLVRCYGIADRLEPFGDRRLGNRFTQDGNLDLCRHSDLSLVFFRPPEGLRDIVDACRQGPFDQFGLFLLMVCQ